MKYILMQIPHLTFTRFIAAIAVVIYHFGLQIGKSHFYIDNNSFISRLFSHGDLAVPYFFVLSGFIMAVRYSNSKKIDKSSYWAARFSRLYPIHLLSLLYMYFEWDFISQTASTWGLFVQLTLTQAWSFELRNSYNWPAWSLSVEVFFYLLFPFIIMLTNRLSLKENAFWIVGLNLVSIIVMQLVNNYFFIIPLPIVNLSSFLVGILSGKIFVEKYKKLIVIPELTKLVFLFIGIFSIVFFVSNDLLYGENHSTLALFFAVFIVFFSLSKNVVTKFFSNKRLIFLGNISFSIYMLHWPLWFVYNRLVQIENHNYILSFYGYLLFVIFISAVHYKYVEEPCRLFLRNNLKVNHSLKRSMFKAYVYVRIRVR